MTKQEVLKLITIRSNAYLVAAEARFMDKGLNEALQTASDNVEFALHQLETENIDIYNAVMSGY